MAGCGGDSGSSSSDSSGDDSGPVDAPPFVLADSGARWIGTGFDDPTASLDEFDISSLKIDPEIVAVEAWWDFDATTEAFQTVTTRATLSIDGQALRNADGVTGSTERTVEDGPIRIAPTADGIRVTYRFDPFGPSDLVDDDGSPIVLRDFRTVLDTEAGDAAIEDVSFVEDLPEIGTLEYDVALESSFSAEPFVVSFSTIETDPDAIAVDDDETALLALDVADRDADRDVAEQSQAEAGCAPSTVEFDGSELQIVSGTQTSTFTFALPAEWTVSIDDSFDPCFPSTAVVDSPPGGTSATDDVRLRLQMETSDGSTIDDLAARWEAIVNVTYDEDGEEVSMEPGDDFYTTFEPLVTEEIWGQPAQRLVGRQADSTLVSNRVFVDLGDAVLTVEYSTFESDEELALIDDFVAAATLE
jgi:hypothetical protein